MLPKGTIVYLLKNTWAYQSDTPPSRTLLARILLEGGREGTIDNGYTWVWSEETTYYVFFGNSLYMVDSYQLTLDPLDCARLALTL